MGTDIAEPEQNSETIELPVDETAFASRFEGYRRELQVHCYRMLGSFEDSEDLVQETFLRAWRKRDSFQGRSTLRAWLYRIATNACLDFLDRHPRQPRTPAAPVQKTTFASPSPDDVPWLQPYPDRLLEWAAPSDTEPDAAVVAKETIELAFLVAIQHLPPRQRAVLILRDVVGQSAGETSELLELSIASVNSALQRARATLKEHLPPKRIEWAPAEDPTEAEKALLQRYMAAIERADTKSMAELLHEDVRVTMPMIEPCDPETGIMLETSWYGRDSYMAGLSEAMNPQSPIYFGEWRCVATGANRQPAVATYARRPGDTEYRAMVVDVLVMEDGEVVEITSFGPEMFARFGLSLTLN